MSHVSKFIKIKKKNKKGRKEESGSEGHGGGEEREREKGKKIHFSLRSKKSDRRFSSEQKAKSVHASRATRGYQNLGVSSNSTR